jgi:hypothetical protein
VIRDMRSGEWERRNTRNMRGLLRDRAKLAKATKFAPHRPAVTFEFSGVPEHVVATAQANASDAPEAVEVAKQRLQERDAEGAPYTWDPKTKLFERLQRLPAVVHVPERREPVARPRERRAVARRASTSSRGSPDGSEPPLDRPRLTRAERDALKAKVDARRREVVRASEKVERSLERHWREATA